MTARSAFATVLLTGVLAACTGSTSTTTSPGSSSSSTGSPAPSGPVTFVPGSYVIDFDEVRSVLSWDGGTGQLKVKNGSTSDLGPPSITAVTDASRTVEATITDAAPVPSGSKATFTVSFPDSLDADHVGLLELSYGGDSWGAMAPLPAG